MKYCRTCGAELRDGAVICPKCGCPTSAYVAQNVNSTPLFISYAASLLLVFAASVWSMFGDTATALYNTITGDTLLNLFMVFFALSASMYLFMSYSISNKKAMGVLIVVGIVLVVGFCVAAKNLSDMAQTAEKYYDASSADQKKVIRSLLAKDSLSMIGYLASSALAIVIGSLGIVGKFKPKTEKVETLEIEELEEIEE